MKRFFNNLTRPQKIVVFLFLAGAASTILLSSKFETFYILIAIFLILSFLILFVQPFWGKRRGLISHFFSIILVIGNIGLLGDLNYVSPTPYWVPSPPVEPFSLLFGNSLFGKPFVQRDEKYFVSQKENCESFGKILGDVQKNYKEVCLDGVDKELQEFEEAKLIKEQKDLAYELAYEKEVQEWVKIRKLVTLRSYLEFYGNPFEERFLLTWLLSLVFISLLQFNHFSRKPYF